MDTCEDSIVITDNFLAIVDGATSRSPILYEGKKNGKVASEIIAKSIAELPEDSTAENAFLSASQKIAEFYEKENLYDHMKENPADRCNASVIIFSKHFNELWLVGDCQALIDGKLTNNVKKVDTLFEELRSFILEQEIMKGKSIEELRQNDVSQGQVIPFIDRQNVFQNIDKDVEFAYFTIDGFFKNTSRIKKISVPINSNVVIASDGYPQLFPTLEETEASLASIIAEDPLCFRKFKSVKGVFEGNISFDDRSYIKFSV